jgi:rhomboid protease GluP
MNSDIHQNHGHLNFYATKNSSLRTTRLGLLGGAAVGITYLIITAKGNGGWFGAVFLIGVASIVDWILRRQMHAGKVLISVDAVGISSQIFIGEIKRFEWNSVSEIAITRIQNVPTLQLVLGMAAGQPDKRSFWTGQNPAKPTLPLSALDDASQEQLLEAIQQHRQKYDVFQAPAKIHNQIAEEKAFVERLKSITPTPWVTYLLIVVNSLIWVASLTKGGTVAGTPADLLLQWGGNSASEVQRGEWWRLASSMFLHNGMMHVGLNMLGLYSVGITVERIYGPRLFALIYLASGLLGGALSLHFAAQVAVSVGASGAVFGVAGALVVGIWEHRRQLPKSISKQTMSSAGIFILYSLVQGFANKGIDNAAHIGGLLAGCTLAYLLPERLDLDRYARTVRRTTVIGLASALVATIALATSAPQAQIDQRGAQHLASGLRAMAEAFKSLQLEAEQVQAGKMSKRESDERSRTVFAPMMRRVLSELSQVKLSPSDSRYPILVDATRMSELLIESLAMESIYSADTNNPEPADPIRSAAISKEIQVVAEHFAALQSKNKP